jgi:hypothetical protein
MSGLPTAIAEKSKKPDVSRAPVNGAAGNPEHDNQVQSEQAREMQIVSFLFGNLAVMAFPSRENGGRPIALRPRFSPGLPLSEICLYFSFIVAVLFRLCNSHFLVILFVLCCHFS